MADVGCAGLLVSDTFCGPMAQLPIEGQLLAVDSMPTRAGGCAANVAIDLAKQGVAVDIAGCVGADPDGDAVASALAGYGIDCAHIQRTSDLATSRTIILIVEGQDRRYIHMFGANREFTTARLNREWLAQLKIFYLGGLFAMSGIDIDHLHETLQFCRRNGVVTMVDVVIPRAFDRHGDIYRLLPEIDWFLPNDDEAATITGRTAPRDQMRSLLDSGARNVVITLGDSGAIAAGEQGAWSCGAYRMQAVDPSGSGDAFTSGIAVGILRGWDMPAMLRYASAIGASATRAVGTTDGVYTPAEAERFLAERPLSVEPLVL